MSYRIEQNKMKFPEGKEKMTIKPIQKIKNIQMSIKDMQRKINILGKYQTKYLQHIDKCVTQCIPILNKKMILNQKDEQIDRKRKQMIKQQEKRLQKLRYRKIRNNQLRTNSKALVEQIKISDASSLRQLSQKNDKIIKIQRQNRIKQNLERSRKVKQKQQSIKQKYRSFHQFKTLDIKKQKMEQKNKIEIIKTNKLKLLKELSDQKDKYQQKLSCTTLGMKRLKLFMNKLQIMKNQNFKQIVTQFQDSITKNQNQNLNQDQRVSFSQGSLQRILKNIVNHSELINLLTQKHGKLPQKQNNMFKKSKKQNYKSMYI